MADLHIKKSIKDLQKEASCNEHGLKRALGPVALVALGIGVIVGAGIFVVTGHAAAQYAGPAIIVSFVLAFFTCGFAGLCYAELASMIPMSGSAYTYAYASLGEFLAWVIGWDLILEYFLGATTVAIGWSGYTTSFLADFGIHLPAILCGSPFDHDTRLHQWVLTGKVLNIPAMGIVFLMTGVIYVGIRESSLVNTIIVILKVSILLIFIAAGAFFVKPELWTPFIPANTGEFGHFGWSGILRGSGVIFFAYIGFDTVSTAAQETKSPHRNMPIGILGSLLFCTILYILVTAVMTGVVHYTKLNDPAPVAVAIDAMKLHFLAPVVKIGAIAGLTSVILVLLYGQARIFYSICADGLLPARLATIHPAFKTPSRTTLITGTGAAVLAGIMPIGVAGELVSIGTLLAFIIVCSGVLVLRYTQPDAPRHFKAPGGIAVPLGGIASCLYLMYGLPADTWLRLVVWFALGLAIYFLYGMKHSKLRMKMQGSL